MKLCRLAYVRRKLVKSTVHRSSWEVFELTNQGQRAIRDAPQRRIMLQPPESILQMERQERQRVQNKLQELRERGIDLSNVPALELESASGPTLTKLTQWNSLVSSLRARGEIAKAEAHEELLLRVFKWRSEVAQTLGMAPAQVLSEPTAMGLIYNKACTVKELTDCGVRVRGFETLALLLQKSMEELGLNASAVSSADAAPKRWLLFPNEDFVATNAVPPWTADPPSRKGKSKPQNWEVSADRFANGESLLSIAMKTGGRTIKTETVARHVLCGLVAGKRVNLKRLQSEMKSYPIHEKEWCDLDVAASALSPPLDIRSPAEWCAEEPSIQFGAKERTVV